MFTFFFLGRYVFSNLIWASVPLFVCTAACMVLSWYCHGTVCHCRPISEIIGNKSSVIMRYVVA